MKPVSCAAFFAFCLTMAAALPAEAAFILQSRKTASTDQTKHIAQDITVKTDGASAEITDWTIQYYLYEDPSTTWATPTLSPSRPGQFVTMAKLDRTYTGSVANPRNANYVVFIWIPNPTIVSGSTSYSVSLNIAATNLGSKTLHQNDDWS